MAIGLEGMRLVLDSVVVVLCLIIGECCVLLNPLVLVSSLRCISLASPVPDPRIMPTCVCLLLSLLRLLCSPTLLSCVSRCSPALRTQLVRALESLKCVTSPGPGLLLAWTTWTILLRPRQVTCRFLSRRRWWLIPLSWRSRWCPIALAWKSSYLSSRAWRLPRRGWLLRLTMPRPM